MDPATVGAWCTGIAAIIASIGAVVKIIVSRPRLPVAEELLEQLDELRDDLLALARWAHHARAVAASEGVELPEPPSVLVSAGHREGERRHDDGAHGWRSAVRVQTGEQVAVGPPSANGPTTIPNRRALRPPPR